MSPWIRHWQSRSGSGSWRRHESVQAQACAGKRVAGVHQAAQQHVVPLFAPGVDMRISASSVCWSRDDRLSVFRKLAAAGFTDVEILAFPEEEICRLHGDLRKLKPSDLRRELA